MAKEPWNKHTPGDPMPCKCGDSVVEVKSRNGTTSIGIAKYWNWGKSPHFPYAELPDWRFAERKGEDVLAADPYNDLEWNDEDVAMVILEKPGQPEWVRDDDLIRFDTVCNFRPASSQWHNWNKAIAFQIKRRPVLTPAEPLRLLEEIERLKAEVDQLREAAKPFAYAMRYIDPEDQDDYAPSWAQFFTIADFRRIAAAMDYGGKDGPE